MSYITRVTNGRWNVSVTTNHQLGTHALCVFRVVREEPGNWKTQYGDHHGRLFPSSDAAFAFAVERGYCVKVVTPWCPTCRVRHLRQRTFMFRGRPLVGFTPDAWCPIEKDLIRYTTLQGR